MTKKYDVITMGSNVIDTFIYTGIGEKEGMICFPAGTKIQINEIYFSVGGGGMNSAVCLSKLGLKVGYLGKIGVGYNSGVVFEQLKKNKIDFLGARGKGHTGYSAILESDKKHRTVLTYKGESDNLEFSEINLNRLNAKWLYFTSMSDKSFESQKRIAGLAKKKGIKLAYNPSSYQTKKGAGYLSEILKNTYLLCLNKEEAEMLAGKDIYKLNRIGPSIVCITDGENEGCVYDKEYLYRFWPNKINVREMTGAGDAFGSSFIAGLIKFNEVEIALKMALANSEHVIQELGAENGLLNWGEMKKIIKKNKFKIRKEVLK